MITAYRNLFLLGHGARRGGDQKGRGGVPDVPRRELGQRDSEVGRRRLSHLPGEVGSTEDHPVIYPGSIPTCPATPIN